ncbi:hypothetical protein BN7_1649 [Wickerhamomyces ciferrii]|uniref:Uncharacterized protein n=1 Tax=Wickerhamomyces ciferrii (strain ATCC 14091 / BCRC 22168 / CBS 111 / JCM 3599 / NBRC 0793 / NRRL Y-1031 F-60-10) TaxID=1206466 RepID=K0KIX7_WICCF|nr:uncharacterized protein BN7_1649 [Wickerhamomyces ciferrii]CCH42107.1 hypothetical protein BN7_1649 [Wickerhamomyces ciferrii]
MGRKRKSAREKRLDNFRSNRSNYLDSTENKKKKMGHKVDVDDKVANSSDKQSLNKSNVENDHEKQNKQKSDNKKVLIYRLISDNKEKLMQNVKSEMVKSSLDIDIRNFYKGLEHGTIEYFKKNFYEFIEDFLMMYIDPEVRHTEDLEIDIIHFVKLVFFIKKNPFIRPYIDNLQYIDTTDTNLIGCFKNMKPKSNFSSKFDDDILREKFIKCENELLDKLKEKRNELSDYDFTTEIKELL